jgi:hypothetical protein
MILDSNRLEDKTVGIEDWRNTKLYIYISWKLLTVNNLCNK